MTKKYQIYFFIILALAAIIRLTGWPTAITQVNCDEIMTAVNAKAIADTGADIYGTTFPVYLEAWGTMGQSVMLMYVMALCIKIFGYSLAVVRLPMMIISLLSIGIVYDLTKRITKSNKIALAAMALIAICPWHLLQSIWSIDCNMFPHFLLFSVYFLYRGIAEKRWMLYLSMLFFGLTMYTYGPAIYFVPIFLLICAIYFLRNHQINGKQLFLSIAVYLLITLPILAMYALNFFHIQTDIHIGSMTIQYFEHNARTSDMLLFSPNILQQLPLNLLHLLKVIFLQYDWLEWNASPVFGGIYHISILFCIIAIIHMIKTRKTKKGPGVFLLNTWLVVSLLLGLLINNTNVNRLNCIWYPLTGLTLYGICVVCKNVKMKKWIPKGIIVGYCILFIAYNAYFFGGYNKCIDNSGCFSKGYIDAVQYAGHLPVQEKFYANTEQDGSLDIYTQFQTDVDKTSIQKISDDRELWDKVNNINGNEAYIIRARDQEKITNSNTQIKQFNEYLVITSIP